MGPFGDKISFLPLTEFPAPALILPKSAQPYPFLVNKDVVKKFSPDIYKNTRI